MPKFRSFCLKKIFEKNEKIFNFWCNFAPFFKYFLIQITGVQRFFRNLESETILELVGRLVFLFFRFADFGIFLKKCGPLNFCAPAQLFSEFSTELQFLLDQNRHLICFIQWPLWLALFSWWLESYVWIFLELFTWATFYVSQNGSLAKAGFSLLYEN